jgi:hypothetical protein
MRSLCDLMHDLMMVNEHNQVPSLDVQLCWSDTFRSDNTSLSVKSQYEDGSVTVDDCKLLIITNLP